jgi:hypothetical protein
MWIEPASGRAIDYWGQYTIEDVQMERGVVVGDNSYGTATLAFRKVYSDCCFQFRLVFVEEVDGVQGHGRWTSIRGQKVDMGYATVREQNV